jgi:hypothetical protein
LSRSTLGLNAGEPRVIFPDSDEVGSGIGLAQVHPSPSPFLRVSKFWGFFLFLFRSDPILLALNMR